MSVSVDALSKAIVVVVHDVSAATLPAVQRLLDALHACAGADLRLTHLVVPRWHGEASSSKRLQRWLDDAAARGDELALHGWTHLDDGHPRGPIDGLRRRLYTAGEGEFAALPARDAALRLRQGRQWFAAAGWPLAGFVPPAWLLGDGAWEALADAGFDYTCTLRTLVALQPRRRERTVAAYVYSTRAPWRRLASRAWNGVQARALRDAPLQRLELHPHDADHAAVHDSWRGLLDRALREQTRRALTLREAVASFVTQPADLDLAEYQR